MTKLNPNAHTSEHAKDVESPSAPPFDPRWDGAVIRPDRYHFHRRLLKRYGIVLGPADYSRIARAIRCGRTAVIEQKPNGTAVYLVRVPSTASLIFVAAKPNGELITALSVTNRLLALVRLQKAKG